jgi:hypothetical protein
MLRSNERDGRRGVYPEERIEDYIVAETGIIDEPGAT